MLNLLVYTYLFPFSVSHALYENSNLMIDCEDNGDTCYISGHSWTSPKVEDSETMSHISLSAAVEKALISMTVLTLHFGFNHIKGLRGKYGDTTSQSP